MTSGSSIESFWFHGALLGSRTRKVDLVCAPEGLVTIVTCSSGEAGNSDRERDRGRMYNILTLYGLIFEWKQQKMDRAQQGDWTHWFLELAGHCMSLELMETLFPITQNTAITVSSKLLLTMAISIHLTSLLGIIEIDSMPDLQILKDLWSLSSFLISKHNLWKPDLLSLSRDGHTVEISVSYVRRIHKQF